MLYLVTIRVYIYFYVSVEIRKLFFLSDLGNTEHCDAGSLTA